jgi:hypothetical protein
MKEWSNKPSNLAQTSSSPVTTVSSSPVGSAGSSIVKTSGSIVKTSGTSMTLTSGSSSTVVSTSSGVASRAAAGAATVAPLAVGTVVGGVAAVFYGVSNMIKYGEHKKTGAQAAKDTVKGSVGIGVSTGLGVAAVHAVAGTALAFGSTVVVPIGAGFATGYISMKIWNKIFFKGKEASKTKEKAK